MPEVKLEGVVEGIEPGRIKGQKIVTVKLANGGTLVHDAVREVIDLSEGDKVSIVLSEERPANLDEYMFCGNGYLVAPESEKGKTIFSVWGLIFIFEPPLGLETDKKYYICIKRK
ncbi:MAG: DNA-directed RNA polymerase subunit G [Desulfurococcales archaeon]|nr:DNA-directed RNA polymerase subunit G [Desulfurococcales archaeon]